MSKNVILTDVNEEQIYPITTSENVFLNPDMTLREFIENLNAGGSAFVLPVASSITLGGVKVGSGLEITEDGTLNCTISGGTVNSLVAYNIHNKVSIEEVSNE